MAEGSPYSVVSVDHKSCGAPTDSTGARMTAVSCGMAQHKSSRSWYGSGIDPYQALKEATRGISGGVLGLI